jgi:hypothetical protein
VKAKDVGEKIVYKIKKAYTMYTISGAIHNGKYSTTKCNFSTTKGS